ncbi:hypothetical protein GCM10009759_60110 [Kitasatospora saccharophila]|uniref:Uncharacterized protein n=1 Tax=Kitasatospora saccharophila TaxID=407973 RepID=A0ABP5JDG0_9ACTN
MRREGRGLARARRHGDLPAELVPFAPGVQRREPGAGGTDGPEELFDRSAPGRGAEGEWLNEVAHPSGPEAIGGAPVRRAGPGRREPGPPPHGVPPAPPFLRPGGLSGGSW